MLFDGHSCPCQSKLTPVVMFLSARKCWKFAMIFQRHRRAIFNDLKNEIVDDILFQQSNNNIG